MWRVCPICPVIGHFFGLELLRIAFANGGVTHLLDLNLPSHSLD